MWARYWLVLKCTQTEGGVHWLDLPECKSIRMGQVTGASGKRNQFESGKLLDRREKKSIRIGQVTGSSKEAIHSYPKVDRNMGALLDSLQLKSEPTAIWA